jgi:hypothetical protein
LLAFIWLKAEYPVPSKLPRYMGQSDCWARSAEEKRLLKLKKSPQMSKLRQMNTINSLQFFCLLL